MYIKGKFSYYPLKRGKFGNGHPKWDKIWKKRLRTAVLDCVSEYTFYIKVLDLEFKKNTI